MNKIKLFKLYSLTSIYIIMLAITLASFGAFFNNDHLLRLHPYIFFIGFGNLSILVLNKYLIQSFYPKLKISAQKQFYYIITIIISLILITISIYFDLPILKIVISFLLAIIIIDASLGLLKQLSFKEIWNILPVRYYTFDLLFLLNAALGLFALGYKETFPNTILVPDIVTESLYFLGSSFPLSVSTMGFIYAAIAKKEKKELLKLFFDLWFYVFILGVITFLLLIIMDTYWGMMISSSTLILGVLVIFYMLSRRKSYNLTIFYLIGAISLLTVTGIFGLMNIDLISGREIGSRLAENDMWIYKIHTHSALMGWISFAFVGILYLVYPYISKDKIIIFSESILSPKQLKYGIIQLLISTLFITMILIGFYLDNRYILFIFGLLFSFSFNIIIYKLIKSNNKNSIS